MFDGMKTSSVISGETGVHARKVRIRDIAAAAGVSPATVSNALTGRKGVGSDNIQRIFELAREMGYTDMRSDTKAEQPASAACIIRLVIVKRHGLVVMDTQFFMELIEAIGLECERHGAELMITHIHMMRDTDWLEKVRGIRADDLTGVLLLGTELDPEELAPFQKHFDMCSVPFVVLDNLFRHEDVHSVVMNNYNAGYIAGRALLDAGHTRLGLITSAVEFNNMRYRRKGFEAALDERGIPFGKDDVFRVTPTIEGAYTDMLAHLSRLDKDSFSSILPTAFFAGNDIIAVGATRAMSERGIVVPRDASIIGMDDLNICLASNPPLSTVRVFREEMGRQAVRMLIAQKESKPQCTMKMEIGVELVMRESVAAMREVPKSLAG
ncbi:transcriptional regulator [Clostridia bacterium]|nr:transcriptional regulator [Clostridia bacterium]